MARFSSLLCRVARHCCWLLLVFCMGGPLFGAAPVVFSRGDTVRLSRPEPLLFKGEIFLNAPKGQEFAVFKSDPISKQVFVPFLKDDGTLIAVAVAAEGLEAVALDASQALLPGVAAFREGRFEDAKRMVLLAAGDPKVRVLASTLAARINAASLTGRQAQAQVLPTSRQAFAASLGALRDSAQELAAAGWLSAALPIEEGVDRLGAQILGAQTPLPPSKLNREDLARRVAISNRCVLRARQSMATRKLMEASKFIEEGLAAEPGRFELAALQTKAQRGVADSEDDFKAADSFRKKTGGVVHALSALQDGLKRCADNPKLVALRKEMTESFEERTAPPVSAAFLSAAGVSGAGKDLEEGHRIYTGRCTECHDLDMLDSRSSGGWEKIVASMARRANLNATQQSRVLAYIAAARVVVEKSGEK